MRFKSNGLDAIEVQDNGHGISPNDYETIGTLTVGRASCRLLTYCDSFETLHLKTFHLQ